MLSRQEELELRLEEVIIRSVELKEATLKEIGYLNGLLPLFGSPLFITPFPRFVFDPFLPRGWGVFC